MMKAPLETLLRPAQNEIMQYKSGKKAVIAVPGSGKTFTLAHLAARLVSGLSARDIEKGRGILIVTFSNTAVNTIHSKISTILEEYGLPAGVGYQVTTLHSLGHQIIAEHPARIGLAADFRVIDEIVRYQLIRSSVLHRIKENPVSFHRYITPALLANESQFGRVAVKELPDLATRLSERFVRHVKDHDWDTTTLSVNKLLSSNPVVSFLCQVYADYQKRVAQIGAVDFDDLVAVALGLLQDDSALLQRMQESWLYILEDEAQDSTLAQEKLLRLLSNNKNWVRVGDPNQAINATFTSSSPQYMQKFMEEDGVKTTTLNESGRSGRPILDLANAFLRWVNQYHPARELRSALLPNSIEASRTGDPQPNPSTAETNVHIYYETGKTVTFQQALQVVLSSLQRWLVQHPAETVAVLVPENSQGYQLAELLRRNRIVHDELLRNREPERLVASALEIVLSYLADPTDARRLSRIYQGVWWPNHLGITSVLREKLTLPEVQELVHLATQFITKQNRPEALFWPSDDQKSFFVPPAHPQYRDIEQDWRLFLNQTKSWLLAVNRPIEALVTLIAQDIFYDPSDLALSHQFALALRSFAMADNTIDLAQCAEELGAVNNNQRRSISALNFTADFRPRPGVVTISTIHAAKGLEWDRVYLLSVNTRSFPSLQPDDTLVGEKWFIRDSLNLESELIALIESALSGTEYVEGEATHQSRLDYAAERLRLLYVGITRARKELILMWDTGQLQSSGGGLTASPARPLIALYEYLSGTLSL